MSNTNEHKPLDWEHPVVDRYEQTIPLKIPGYETLYEITKRMLNEQMGGENTTEEILNVGAGGGQECVTLGSVGSNRVITGIDPSKRMLEIARSRVKKASLKQRVKLIQGSVENLPDGQLYDAATCMLVLHFISGMEAKRELLHGIAKRLKPGAPLFLSSINGEPGTPAFDLQIGTWVKHMQNNGICPEETARFTKSFNSTYDPIPTMQVLKLLEETGFKHASSYFGVYLINAWVATRVKE